VRLRLPYHASTAIAAPVVAVEIEHLGGATVTAPCTRDVGMVPERFLGDGVVEVVFDTISLLPGTYDVHTSITDFNRAHVFDHLHSALRFDVMSGTPYETGTGVVTLRPTWTST
jgi:hypothetical protein